MINGSYDAEVEFTRTLGSGAIWTRISVQSHPCEVILCDQFGQASGLNMVDGLFLRDSKAPIAVRPGEAPKSAPLSAPSQRRVDSGGHASLDVSLDGKRYLPRWIGDPASLSEWSSRSLPNPRGLGLGANQSEVTFHSARLRMLSGSATLDPALVSENRSPDAAPTGDTPADSAHLSGTPAPGRHDAAPPSVGANPEPPTDPVQAHTVWTGDHDEKLTILAQKRISLQPVCSWATRSICPCPAALVPVASVGRPTMSSRSKEAGAAIAWARSETTRSVSDFRPSDP